jgi:Ca2+-transporting ATPase
MVEQPWAKAVDDVLDELDVTPPEGLDSARVRQRRERCGPNRLREAKKTPAWRIMLEQFKSLVVVLLAVAALVSLAFCETTEAMAIAAVILINAVIGFVTELQAVRSMEALRELGSVSTRVRREGQIQEVKAEKLVPGDIVLVSGGDIVTADLRFTQASKLQADESALTGESVPVSKQVEPCAPDTSLAERANMLFKGTAVTRGSGEGVVVGTGMETQLGRISSLVEEAEEGATPLEERLAQLSHRLIGVTLAVGVFVAVGGILAGKDALLMVETGIALAVASVPEGLPIVATVALARGMWRMAQRNALISRLSAVETLGSTTVILTDKTGTLTENRMTVTDLHLDGGEIAVSGTGLQTKGEFRADGSTIQAEEHEILSRALRVGVLCNNASLQQEKGRVEAVGEPMEIALLVAGAKANLQRESLLEQWPEVREVAFDTQVNMMATFHNKNGGHLVAVKGAPEAVLEASVCVLAREDQLEMTDEARQDWLARSQAMAAEGLRVLALATREAGSEDQQPYQDLNFLGLVGLLDPPRDDVREAIRACKRAGVGVTMVTGDHGATARSIAVAVGVVDGADAVVVEGTELKALQGMSHSERRRVSEAHVFARVTPRQKLDLIMLHQQSGEIVAMTGDGVNDAPALKKADIGVAMGKRGTEVAREAADMVVRDDAFSTIVAAIEQGRVIFDNIRRFVLYLLSCNVSEVVVVGAAALLNVPLPIRPLQILFLNLVTDVFPALALGVGQGDPVVMRRPPRPPEEPLLAKSHWLAVAGHGAVITLSVLGAFALAFRCLGVGYERGVSISFLTLALAQLWHVFNMRDRRSGLVDNDVTRNRAVWAALALCVVLLLAAVYVPPLARVLRVAKLGAEGWSLAVGASLLPLLVGQLAMEWPKRRSSRR